MSSLTTDAKKLLSHAIRGLRERLLRDIRDEAERRYHLSVPLQKAGLDEALCKNRERLESWLDERARATGSKKEKDKSAARERFLGQAVKEAGATLLNRLALIRHLEAQPEPLSKPHVVTGGWNSRGYQEWRDFAPALLDDETHGYATLLQLLFDELAVDLPGLFGEVGLTRLFPVPPATLREVIAQLDDKALASAWTDDTTLGWIYQYWNDPERESLDAKINAGGKIEPHEIASKTQMFTERYMVEWLLQNSLGVTWLCICKTHEQEGWTPDAERVLPMLEARRAEWRKKREAGEVALDALMPIASEEQDGGLEDAWKYFVPQEIPQDAIEKAPASIRELKLLDPACGSGHFLVIAFGLLVRMYREEARHRGERWPDEKIAESILANNLHGVDIDPRAIQLAAAGLYLKAKALSPKARLSRVNLVAPALGLGSLPYDDPARAELRAELKSEVGIPEELATAQGRKDYDWAHLAARYFPKRVRDKCVADPSLAVAHNCFWELHPAKAYAWELRLQDEIKAGFTIDEPGSDEARTRFLTDHAADARDIEAAEQKRRDRKAAKADGASDESELPFEQSDEAQEEA